MLPQRFDHLLTLVGPRIKKKNDINFRKDIPPAERLAVTLKFLASGESQQSLAFLFPVGRSTIAQFIRETCDAIYTNFSNTYLHPPCSANDWINISKEFNDLWNFPHAVGATDGKHVTIECPSKSETLFYNYKNFYSIVLLAICDAKYNFILFAIGQYGRNNNYGVLSKSTIGKQWESKSLNFSEPATLKGCEYDPLTYILLGDEAVPLKECMMRPFPGQLDENEKIFNYRHLRGRRVVENSFGILIDSWRILEKPIKATVENVEWYLLAKMPLHDYWRQTENASYCPTGYVDCESSSRTIKPGEWRNLVDKDIGCLRELPNVRGSRSRQDLLVVRDGIKNYFKIEQGQVDWQYSTHMKRKM